MNSLWQWVLVLLFFVIVIGVLWFIGRYSRNWLGNFRIPSEGKRLKVIDSVALDFKTHLFLVSVSNGGEYLVADNGNYVHILPLLQPTGDNNTKSQDNSSDFEQILNDVDSKSSN